MQFFIELFQSSMILICVTTLTVIIGIFLTNIKTLLSVRVEKPMNMVIFFGLVGLPFVHIQFSYEAATLIVLIMTLILNVWVIYTMYKEQLVNEQMKGA